MLYYKICRISDISSISVEETLALLSKEQKEYVSSFNGLRQKQSLYVRSLLNNLLCEKYKDINVSALSVAFGGKPCVEGSNLYISLAHSGDYLGCAVSSKPVGIDIEKIRQVKDATVNRVCTTEEQGFIKANSMSAFFTLWTLKEAYVKASRTKLCVSDVSFVENGKFFSNGCKIITNEIDGYVWSVIEIE